MMNTMELICISCPMGCPLKVIMRDKEVIEVLGNSCQNGYTYGKKECTNPRRIVTSTVRLQGGLNRVLSVKTENDIPKELIFDTMKILKEIDVEAPVKIGDIIVKNILNTGINIVATANATQVI